MKPSVFPGWLLLLLVAMCSKAVSDGFLVAGKPVIEASALAIILGILIRNFNLLPKRCIEGVQASEKLLILGIVLLGADLDYNKMFAKGAAMVEVVLAVMLIGLVGTYFLGLLFKLSQKFSILLAVGTSICGTSAIAITAPLIKAKEEETSYAVGIVALWGLLAVLTYPLIGRALEFTDFNFGVFAGTAIHSTPQVVGAGYMFSSEAGNIATAIKLIRNCFMAPLALLLGLWYAKKNTQVELNYQRAFPWFLFAYFLMAYFNSVGFFTLEGIKAFSNAGKFLILLAMAGIGLNTNLLMIKTLGIKPLLVGFLGSIILAGVSYLLIVAIL